MDETDYSKRTKLVYEAAACISDSYITTTEQDTIDRQNKLGMTKKEMESLFSKYTLYKESVMTEIMPVYNDYIHMERYFQVIEIDNLMGTIACFLTYFVDDIASLKGDQVSLDKLINKSISSLLHNHVSQSKDSEIDIQDLTTLLNYLEQVNFNDKTKLLLINLYNNRYEVLEELSKLLEQCVPILKKNFYIIEDDFNKAIDSVSTDDSLNTFINKTLGINVDIPDNAEFYFSIFNFNQMSMMDFYDHRVVSYIGIYLEDLVKLSEENKFNDAQILSDLKAIGDPTRLRIIGLLANKKMYLQEIAETLDLTPSTISHHVQILLNSMLISITLDTVNSRKVYYKTNKKKVQDLGDSIKNLVSNKIF
ncbi:MAG: winged helix-turn-helix transcriptional regulator [Tissierella sp.]|nr:winged helix-turn-helix transcriptional regulator [Tissierella sp.]